MTSALRSSSHALEDRLDRAIDLLLAQAADFSRLDGKVRASRTPWSLAGLVEPLDGRYSLPPPLPSYTVAASDGSQIEPDRHGNVLYHLINVGWAVIRYGDRPNANIASEPVLYYQDEHLYMVTEGRRTLVAGLLLDLKRNVEEMTRLALLAEEAERDHPVVALVDGILMMRAAEGWRLQEFHTRMLPRFQASLAQFEALGVPVAGYISRPRTHELIGTLRVAACPHPRADCNSICAGDPKDELCAMLSGIPDRLLMERLPLVDGERSACFRSSAGGEGTSTYFFYLNVGSEIARLEVPGWVAAQPELLDIVQWVAYDQCRKGGSYPRVLTEAHERAVLTVSDRQQFERIVDGALAQHRLSERTSAKERSKRLRSL